MSPVYSSVLKFIISFFFKGDKLLNGDNFPVLSNYIYAF